jgi:5-methyltetrahydrofolate--homocysteine methyltransferase
MFFRTWGVKDKDAKEMEGFCADALAMLENLKKVAKPKIRVGVFEASSVGDDIELFENGEVVETLRLMRSQAENSKGECLCLADYVAPKSSDMRDYVGLYTATAGVEADEFAQKFKSEGDDYSYMMVQTLCDAIAEALSVYSQKKIFADNGTARAGVRSAVGYASYPDHSEKEKFARLLSLKESVGVELTDSL